MTALFSFKDDPSVVEYTRELQTMTKVVLEVRCFLIFSLHSPLGMAHADILRLRMRASWSSWLSSWMRPRLTTAGGLSSRRTSSPPSPPSLTSRRRSRNSSRSASSSGRPPNPPSSFSSPLCRYCCRRRFVCLSVFRCCCYCCLSPPPHPRIDLMLLTFCSLCWVCQCDVGVIC